MRKTILRQKATAAARHAARWLSLSVFLLALLTTAQAHAQSEPVTLNMQGASVKAVFREIEKQTHYTFVFRNNLVSDQSRTTVKCSGKKLSEVLKQMLAPLGLTYTLSNRTITLRKATAPAEKSPAPKQQQPATTQQSKGLVTGRVIDTDGEPVTGAVVRIPGTARGTNTDIDGNYSIQASNGESLEFSFIGYTTQTVKIKNASAPLDITLATNAKTQMDEVVVIGYGQVKKTDMTGSVTNVKMGDIKDAPVLSVDQALQGRVAGADIMSSTGEPGSNTSIRIRGTRSISASNEPLIVVDGVMDAVHDLNDLNMADIQSISILKDASSTAIYGSRGSNGVIIITTKKGASLNKPNVTFKADVGFSQLPRGLDIMDASEFAQYRNDYAYFNTANGNDAIVDGTPQSKYPYPDPFSLGKGTDWIKEITRTAPTQNYALSVSGRSDKTSYYGSLSYNDTEGIIDNSGMKRFTGLISLDHRFAKWLKVGYKGNYTHRDQDMNLAAIGGTAYYQAAMYLSPFIKASDSFNPLWGNGQKINTPRSTIDLNTNNFKRKSMNHTLTFTFDILPSLVLRSQNSYFTYDRMQFRYYPSTLPRKVEGEGGEAYRSDWNEWSLSTENTITYNFKSKSGHAFDVLGGFTAYRYKSDELSISGKGYMDDNVKWNNMNAVPDKETYSVASGSTRKTKMSLLARFNYNYKQRYYITVTGRYDGASNFAKNNKWAFFPSGALKWNVANESFMKGLTWLDEFSIRASAGRTGNDAISAYRSMAALSSTTNGYLFDGSQPVAYYPSRLASPNLTWEQTDLYNIATDVSLFNGRLTFTAEGYISKTKDLLLTVRTASQSGYTSRFTNLGKTTNKGVEFSIESRNIANRDFIWTTNFTIAHNKQKVDDIGSEDFVSAQDSPGNNPYMMQGYVKGYPLNALWGFRYAGVWHSVDEYERNKVTKAYAAASINDGNIAYNLGTPRYLDQNRDGVLSQDDLVYLGNADPAVYGGLQNTIRYRNFRLGVYFTYSIGGKIYNFSELYMAGSDMSNQYRYMLDSWHPVRNPDSDKPRAGAVNVHVPSDFQVHDASYLRLKNVTLGYTLDLSDRCKWMRDIQFTISGENLWLWKRYNGFDPDVSSESGSALRRVDMGAYPKARTFVFSLQLRY